MIVDRHSAQPQTHALLIGVGHYPYLVGGEHEIPDPLDLGQLSSPPVSARRMTDWLIKEFTNVKIPLGSLDVLIASDESNPEYIDPMGHRHALVEPTMANIDAAVRDWATRCHSNTANLAFFYFCGHGLSKGQDTFLLASDFGRNAADIMKDTIQLEGLHLGMDRTRARNQCFFVDCCRNTHASINDLHGELGAPILRGRAASSGFGDRAAPIYYATGRDQSAYGLPGAPSRFTDTLLQALHGLGADDASGQWIVDSMSLGTALTYLFERENKRTNRKPQNCKVGGQAAKIEIHYLNDTPLVPVTIGCDPATANSLGDLVIQNGVQFNRGKRDASDWERELKANQTFNISVNFPGGEYTSVNEPLVVRPPHRAKRLRVRP